MFCGVVRGENDKISPKHATSRGLLLSFVNSIKRQFKRDEFCAKNTFDEEVSEIEKETSTEVKSLPLLEYEGEQKKKSLIVV
jgi:hypothetical protein